MPHEQEKTKQNSPENKTLGFQEATAKIQQLKEQGFRVILAQGVFDIVHVGHVDYFGAAKMAGDKLFVGIEKDETVRLNKDPHRPFCTFNDRLEFLTELNSIDFVFGFDNTPNYDRDVDMYIQRYK